MAEQNFNDKEVCHNGPGPVKGGIKIVVEELAAIRN